MPRDLALIKQGLRVTEAFASWPPNAIQKLLPAAYLGRYPRGAPVRRERAGHPEVLLVLSGHLMMSRSSPERLHGPMAVIGPGMLVGIARGLDPADEIAGDYRAHDAAVVVHLPTQALLDILDADPTLWKSMARTLVKQQHQLLVTLLHHLSGPLRQRLAATLVRLVQLYGVDDNGRNLRLRLSQEDLAAMLQVTRQSINREMRAFEAQGLIRAEYGAVIVRELDALRALGGGV